MPTILDELLQEGINKGRKEGINKGRKEGLNKGAHQKAIKTANKMLQKGYPLETIAEITELPISEIQKLQVESEKKT